MKLKLKFAFIFVLLVLFAVFAGAASADLPETKRVTQTGAGDKSGSSWENAMDAVALVTFLDGKSDASAVEIWVAKGTYSPGATPELTFNLKKGVQLYGGFAGGETSRGARDWKKNATVLSGGTGGGGKQNYNVVSCIGAESAPGANPTNSDTCIDGFSIINGYAYAPEQTNDHANGGGMIIQYASPTIENCYVANNRATFGGGAFEILNSSPVIKNCTFTNNANDGRASDTIGSVIRYHHGEDGGLLTIDGCTFADNLQPSINSGAIFAQANGTSKIKISNSVLSKNFGGKAGGALYIMNIGFEIDSSAFIGNQAINGGAVFIQQAAGSITNCTFSGNSAQGGAAVGTRRASPVIVNCTFAENSDRYGGAVDLLCGPDAALAITNSIFWGNKAGETGAAIHISHEADDHEEHTALILMNSVIKSSDVVVKPWNYDYITVISRDLVNADPLITSRDINGEIATKPEDVYIYGLASNSPAINKGLPVGVQSVENVEITVPATDQVGAPRPNPAKGTRNADIGSDEYYDHKSEGEKPKSSGGGCTAAPIAGALALLFVPIVLFRKFNNI